MQYVLAFLIGSNQILTAGIAITAFSLLLYSLTFNLRDRVARAFAALLFFVTIVYFCEAVSNTSSPASVVFWLRLQWLGIAFIPVTYLHFSDALLATVGQPSRGRRRGSIRILYLIAATFLVAALLTDILVYGPVIETTTARLKAGPLFSLFLAYFLGSLTWASWNFVRAYRRTQTSTTRRRMIYLMTSAAAPAIGTFPFLLVAGPTAVLHPLTFWTVAVVVNLAVATLLAGMAYAVAFFGVITPDRVVKGRLFQWLLRGPLTATTVLVVYYLLVRFGPLLPGYSPRLLPVPLIATLLLLQFFITLVRLPVERLLFYGADRMELNRLRVLEERLLTSGDLRQFLESVLASLSDRLRIPSAFIAAFGVEGRLEYEVSLGEGTPPRTQAELPPLALQRVPAQPQHDGLPANGNGRPNIQHDDLFAWGEYWLLPLRTNGGGEPLGLLGLRARTDPLNHDELELLHTLADRATAALEDRRLQREVFQALDRLLPQIEEIQRLRAAAQPSGAQDLARGPSVIESAELTAMIKNALSHYWGGPKLTSSPLTRLRVVEQALREHDGNTANALRAVLRQAIERIKPEGQRKFTAEWILYNILEMKFLQGRRVREVAMRLAVSEADLYRKQRTAIEQVARAIAAMEAEASNGAAGMAPKLTKEVP
jgi:hypothetical protein